MKIKNEINERKKKQGISDRTINTILVIIAAIWSIIVLYPMIFVFSSSVSSGEAVTAGQVYLWPVEFSLKGYELVFKNKLIWGEYLNSFYYTIAFVIIHVAMTIAGAYPLSRKNYQAKGFVTKYFTVSRFFGGGLIPTYMLIANLGLVNTRTWMIISGAVSISHIIIMRTFFQSNIPYELLESAKIDGITDHQYLLKIVLPLSKAVISVICLYATVTSWNAYFTPMLYLRDRELYPLQLVVNDILNKAKIDTSSISDTSLVEQMASAVDAMKYAVIVVAIVPMLIIYPFVQKFFEKGVTMGSIKG